MLPGRNDAEMGPQTRYTLRRKTTSVLKDLIQFRWRLLEENPKTEIKKVDSFFKSEVEPRQTGWLFKLLPIS